LRKDYAYWRILQPSKSGGRFRAPQANGPSGLYAPPTGRPGCTECRPSHLSKATHRILQGQRTPQPLRVRRARSALWHSIPPPTLALPRPKGDQGARGDRAKRGTSATAEFRPSRMTPDDVASYEPDGHVQKELASLGPWTSTRSRVAWTLSVGVRCPSRPPFDKMVNQRHGISVRLTRDVSQVPFCGLRGAFPGWKQQLFSDGNPFMTSRPSDGNVGHGVKFKGTRQQNYTSYRGRRCGWTRQPAGSGLTRTTSCTSNVTIPITTSATTRRVRRRSLQAAGHPAHNVTAPTTMPTSMPMYD